MKSITLLIAIYFIHLLSFSQSSKLNISPLNLNNNGLKSTPLEIKQISNNIHIFNKKGKNNQLILLDSVLSHQYGDFPGFVWEAFLYNEKGFISKYLSYYESPILETNFLATKYQYASNDSISKIKNYIGVFYNQPSVTIHDSLLWENDSYSFSYNNYNNLLETGHESGGYYIWKQLYHYYPNQNLFRLDYLEDKYYTLVNQYREFYFYNQNNKDTTIYQYERFSFEPSLLRSGLIQKNYDNQNRITQEKKFFVNFADTTQIYITNKALYEYDAWGNQSKLATDQYINNGNQIDTLYDMKFKYYNSQNLVDSTFTYYGQTSLGTITSQYKYKYTYYPHGSTNLMDSVITYYYNFQNNTYIYSEKYIYGYDSLDNKIYEAHYYWNNFWDMHYKSSFYFSVHNLTSIEDHLKLANIVIYPNPVENELNLQNIQANSEISIFNLQGGKVLSRLSSSENESLDVECLKSGVYLVQIVGKFGVKTAKFIKQ